MGISGDFRIRRFPGWDGLEFVEARHVVGDVPLHAHQSCCVGLVMEGVRMMRTGGRIETYGPGRLWILAPGEAHACSTGGGAHAYRTLCFEPAKMGEILGLDYSGWDPSAEGVDWREETQAVLEAVGGAGSIIEAEKPLREWLTKHFYTGNASQEKPDATSVKRIRRYLEEHYTEPHSLEDLAGMAGCSPFHLERTFRHAVGVPIHLYQKLVRLRKARKLLREGRPLAYVATETGFVDQSHFSKTFKAVMGITPGEYAKACGKDHR